jgi:hypothetical protein
MFVAWEGISTSGQPCWQLPPILRVDTLSLTTPGAVDLFGSERWREFAIDISLQLVLVRQESHSESESLLWRVRRIDVKGQITAATCTDFQRLTQPSRAV